jgi:hypothetical protein
MGRKRIGNGSTEVVKKQVVSPMHSIPRRMAGRIKRGPAWKAAGHPDLSGVRPLGGKPFKTGVSMKNSLTALFLLTCLVFSQALSQAIHDRWEPHLKCWNM